MHLKSCKHYTNTVLASPKDIQNIPVTLESSLLPSQSARRQPTFWFLSPCISAAVLELHVNGMIACILFCIWLRSGKIYIYIFIYIYIYVNLCQYVYAYTYKHVNIYKYTHVYIYICKYNNSYIYIYTNLSMLYLSVVLLYC